MGKLLAIAGTLVLAVGGVLEFVDGLGGIVDAMTHPVIAALAVSVVAMLVIVRISRWIDDRI